MAWTPEKNNLLYKMLKKRFSLEGNINEWISGGVTRSWTEIVDKNLLDDQKQRILNDLIDDHLVRLEKSIASLMTNTSALNDEKTTLTSNKEVLP